MDLPISPFVLSNTPYITAFLAGVFGSVHCLGMCGGIIGALACGMPQPVRQRPLSALRYLFAYNAGRILSYAAAGAAVGWLGNLAGGLLVEYQSWVFLRFFAGLFMVALGLYVGGWWFGLIGLERLGAVVWQRFKPLGQRLLPVRNARQAVMLGAVWGWLPCGLVYSILIWALAAGGWQEGAYFMISFGLGTLPALLAVGLTSAALGNALQRPSTRRLAGAMIIAFGMLTLLGTVLYQPNVGLGCAVHPR